jgi:hypothetical protein
MAELVVVGKMRGKKEGIVTFKKSLIDDGDYDLHSAGFFGLMAGEEANTICDVNSAQFADESYNITWERSKYFGGFSA